MIFVLTCAGYMTGVWSLASVAMTSISALAMAGALSGTGAGDCVDGNRIELSKNKAR